MIRPFGCPKASTPLRILSVAAAALLFFMMSSLCGPFGLSVASAGQQPQASGSGARKSAAEQAHPNPIKIGIVRKEPDGANCSLQLPADFKKQNERSVFNSGYENSSDDCECAFMNIDGRTIKLKRINSKWPPGGDDKVGNRGVQVYAAGDIRVHVNYTVTHVCGPRDGEDCESTEFSATIIVTRPGASTTLDVRGSCGV
jgi:hypothetical protein